MIEAVNQISTVKNKRTEAGLSLPVMETFYSLQGEGFHQGRAAYFIRLGGCNVGCFWCDVKESWDVAAHPEKTIEEIIEEMESGINLPQINYPLSFIINNKKFAFEHHSGINHNPIIVITGGEPLLHNLDALTMTLQKKGFQTHIETSGSSDLSGFWNWICLSPKKFKKPLPGSFAAAHELKIVIYNKSDFKWAEENVAKVSAGCKLYLQPEWSKAAEITPLILDYIKQNPKWQLSLQVHKYLNIL